MIEIAPGWEVELERGPDWIFARLHCPLDGSAAAVPVADSVWLLLEKEFTYRLVFELDELFELHDHMLDELVELQRRIQSQGGMLRLCGLSDSNQATLRLRRLDKVFPYFRDREEALMGHRPKQPR